jgi:hypothetical protein
VNDADYLAEAKRQIVLLNREVAAWRKFAKAAAHLANRPHGAREPKWAHTDIAKATATLIALDVHPDDIPTL